MPLLVGRYHNDALVEEACLLPGGRYLMAVGSSMTHNRGWLVTCDDLDDGGTVKEVEYPFGASESEAELALALLVVNEVNIPVGSPIELRTIVESRTYASLTVARPTELMSVSCLYCQTKQSLFGFGPHTNSHDNLLGDDQLVLRQFALYRNAALASLSASDQQSVLAGGITELIRSIDWERFRTAFDSGRARRVFESADYGLEPPYN